MRAIHRWMSGSVPFVLLGAALVVSSSPTAAEEATEPCGSAERAAAAQRATGELSDAMSSNAGQDAMGRLDRVREDYGTDYLGAFIDYNTNEYVIVTSKGSEALSSMVSSAKSLDAPFPVRVQEGCTTQARLEELRSSTEETLLKVESVQAFGLSIDPPSSTLVVTVDGKPDESWLKTMEQEEDVTIEYSSVSRLGRNNDPAPHWGGAKITHGSYACSSGIAMKENEDPDDRFMTTAGHCWGEGANIASGQYNFGEVVNRAPFPQYDIEKIDGSGYTDSVYGDPGPFPVLDVVNGSNPSVGLEVCQSGYVTEFTCNITVNDLSSTLCDGGCTHNLAKGSKPGDNVSSRCGDSGSPVFTVVGAADINIKGSLVGSTISQEDNICNGLNMLFQKTGTIEDVFSATVLKSN